MTTLVLPRETIEALIYKEARKYFEYLSLHANLFGKQKLTGDSLLGARSSRRCRG